MKKISLVLSLCVVLSSLSCKQKTTTEHDSTAYESLVVSPQEMQQLLKLDEVQLVDVRTPSEFSDGHIDTAQNIDFRSPTFAQDILKLDKEKPVLLYCHSGGRSAKCAKKLQEAGFKKIYDLEGGISRWKHEGLAIKQ